MVVEAGDILLYRHAPTITTRLIELGEVLEDGKQSHEYYHVAIALSSIRKIEANGNRVQIAPVNNGGIYDVYRPPLSSFQIHMGLAHVKAMEGQRYDWLLIVDDALRYLTHNLVHLPVRWVKRNERYMKICSTLAAEYLKAAKFVSDVEFTDNTSPEDIWLAVKDYRR